MKSKLVAYLQSRPRLFDSLRKWYGLVAKTRYPLHQPLLSFTKFHKKPVRFIQLGASDGMRSDPIRPFVVDHGWQGILVEPIPSSFQKLRHNYRHCASRLTFLNVAITYPKTSLVTLFRYSDAYIQRKGKDHALHLLQKTSFDPIHLRKWDADLDPSLDITSFCVPATTVEELTLQFPGQEFDALAMDLEGLEYKVLMSIDFTQIHPSLIIFEADHLAQREIDEIQNHLKDFGYTVNRFGSDAIAWHSNVIDSSLFSHARQPQSVS
jgi:FkbM family methyltransferase